MPKEKEKLENAFKQLEKIVEELSKNNLDLEMSLEKFKKAINLIKICKNQLKKVENQFFELKKELEDLETLDKVENNFQEEY